MWVLILAMTMVLVSLMSKALYIACIVFEKTYVDVECAV